MNENELRKKYFFVHFYTWNLAKNHSIIYIYDVVINSKKCSCYFDKKSYINLLFFCSCVYSALDNISGSQSFLNMIILKSIFMYKLNNKRQRGKRL